MFRFIELAIHNWDLWQPVRIKLDRDIVVITGPNGSGKTTLLDAVRQLLNAPRLSSKRRLQHYLRRPDAPVLIQAVVSNEEGNGTGRPFRRERLTTPEVTLCCMLVPNPGGSPEKRFAILPGRPPLEEVRKLLLESRDWYHPERYERALENAGVTRSLMHVLAIEQGQANALFDLKPRDLFVRVLEMLGDRAVLDRYRDARKRYDESMRELSRQSDSLKVRQVDLNRLRREVERLESWERARERVTELENRLPAAELQALIRQRRDVETKVPELTTKVRNGEAERIRLLRDLSIFREAEGQASRDLESARRVELQAQDRWGEAQRREAVAAKIVQDLEAKSAEMKNLPAGDFEKLEKQAEQTAKGSYDEERRLEEERDRRGSLEEQVRSLRAGIPVYPESVRRTLQTLKEAGVSAVILCSTVEAVDPQVAAAAEAALGNARFGLIVDESDEKTALEIAKAHDFPGPILGGKGLNLQARVGALSLRPGAPLWLEKWMSQVILGPDGTWSDLRGTWVMRAEDSYLGTAALRTSLAKAEAELGGSVAFEKECEKSVETARRLRDEVAQAVAREKERRRILDEARALPEARAEAAGAAEALRAVKGELEAAREAVERAQADVTTASQARIAAESHFQELDKRLEGERRALTEAHDQLRSIELSENTLRERVLAPLLERVERFELEGVDTVRADLARAREEFSRAGEPPPPEVRDEERHLRANVEELEQHVADRFREAEAARTELAECRKRYLDIVYAALYDYVRRVKDLARIAAVEPEIDLPQLVDDDAKLDEAGIHVRFGFDGKEPVPLGDPSFSGGQQVIAGLILLMAMAETEGQGFFMLDEPFAHLSLDRVDQVGRFLKGTKSQFIITAPTTLDRAQLDPASLVLVLSKKRPDQPYAPMPIVAEA